MAVSSVISNASSRPNASNQVAVEKVSPVIGAVLSGVDLSKPLDQELFDVVHDALMEHLVLFFRNQNLTQEQLKEFAQRFGPIEGHTYVTSAPDGHPEIFRLVNDETNDLRANRWHTDMTSDPEPPYGSVLTLRQLPEVGGGDTMWASMYAAYEALSPAIQKFLEGLTAIHDGKTYVETGIFTEGVEVPISEHPVIRTHPVTGRRGIFVNSIFTRKIVQLSQSESDAILTMLYQHCALPEFQCRYPWQVGDVAIWDNRCTQHYAIHDYGTSVRIVDRATIRGGGKPFLRL